MANVRRGEASFETSGGTTYRIVMDFAAFAEAEDAAGLGIEELMKAISPEMDARGNIIRTPRIKHLGAMLYGGLTAHHPGITPRDALNLLGEGEAVGAAIAKALQGALPEPDPSAEGKGAARRGTGTAPRKTGRQKA